MGSVGGRGEKSVEGEAVEGRTLGGGYGGDNLEGGGVWGSGRGCCGGCCGELEEWFTRGMGVSLAVRTVGGGRELDVYKRGYDTGPDGGGRDCIITPVSNL